MKDVFLSLRDNVEMVSVEDREGGCYQVEGLLGEIVSLAFHCWEG